MATIGTVATNGASNVLLLFAWKTENDYYISLMSDV